MTEFNADFWEIAIDFKYLDNVPASRALWFETAEDRDRRYAFQELYRELSPVVSEMIDSELTLRQREVVRLYYFLDKTQEDIAAILNLSQSTVSRHLFGTVRGGKKVGGAIPKLQKAITKRRSRQTDAAFGALEARLARAV